MLSGQLTGMDFRTRLKLGSRASVIAEPGYWNYWGGSVAKQDGAYYRFTGRWPESGVWWFGSEITLAGPSQLLDGTYPILKNLTPSLSEQNWAATWVHGPMVYRFGGTWYLYYVAHGNKKTNIKETLRNRSVGVATSKHLQGPWTPYDDNPLLAARPSHWDHYSTTNVSVFELADGRYGMLYKGRGEADGSQRIAMATSHSPLGPWKREDTPNFCPELNTLALEDICVWIEQGMYWAAVKTFESVCGVPASAAILLYSQSGLPNSWTINPKAPIAWDTSLRFEDESAVKHYRHVEFPFVYVEDGSAAALINGVHPGEYNQPGAMSVLRLLKPLA